MNNAEFRHRLTLAEVAHGKSVTLSADDQACAAIARRLGLIGVDHFHVNAETRGIAGGASAKGVVNARVVQACAATGLPVPATVKETFDLRFLRDIISDQVVEEEEVEISSEDCEIVPLDGEAFDLGDAAVQTLSLALDPFPRHPDADRILAEKGILKEEDAGPFAALAALRDKLTR